LAAKNKKGNKQPGRERASWRGDKVSMAGTEVKRCVIWARKKDEKKTFYIGTLEPVPEGEDGGLYNQLLFIQF
jgi:hypothetical protein